MGWEISVSERIYHNLANELLFKIIDGTIPTGDKLPSISILLKEAILLPTTSRLFLMPVNSILSKKQHVTKPLC